jgi:aldose 1-epimerase
MFKSILLVASAAASTLAFAPTDPFQKYNLSAPGINATFIGYGARLTNLFVNDRNGTAQDVVLGYDDPYQYLKDDATNHTYVEASF